MRLVLRISCTWLMDPPVGLLNTGIQKRSHGDVDYDFRLSGMVAPRLCYR